VERTQFTFYESFFQAISRIKKEADQAKAYNAICRYALYETEPDLDSLPDAVAIAFISSKPNLDASRKKAASGKKGGERKQTGSKPEANRKQTGSEKENKKENEKENKKEKEDECPPPVSPSLGGGPGLQAVFEDWLAYKKERREPYKPTGLKSLVTQVQNAARQYGEQAVADLIRTSMASNWAGIAFDRLQRVGTRNSDGRAGNVFMDMLREEQHGTN